MRTHEAGSTVEGGFYGNTRSWEIAVIQGRKGVLPETGSFVRIPAPLLLVLAPALGALYVLFLPFIGFALLGQAVWQKRARALAPIPEPRVRA